MQAVRSSEFHPAVIARLQSRPSAEVAHLGPRYFTTTIFKPSMQERPRSKKASNFLGPLTLTLKANRSISVVVERLAWWVIWNRRYVPTDTPIGLAKNIVAQRSFSFRLGNRLKWELSWTHNCIAEIHAQITMKAGIHKIGGPRSAINHAPSNWVHKISVAMTVRDGWIIFMPFINSVANWDRASRSTNDLVGINGFGCEFALVMPFLPWMFAIFLFCQKGTYCIVASKALPGNFPRHDTWCIRHPVGCRKRQTSSLVYWT